jgi:hypothetical protein
MNAQLIPEVYGKDWTMRLYHGISRTKYPRVNQLMCEYECKYPHLDLCHVEDLQDDWPGFSSKYSQHFTPQPEIDPFCFCM